MSTARRPIEPFVGWPLAELACIDPAKVKHYWPQVSGWVEAAIKRGDLGKFSEVERDVLTGGALLWLVLDPQICAAIVTQIVIVESGKCCVIVAAGGRGVIEASPLLSHIEDYARREGCRKTRIMGRKGWVRALQQYKQTRVVLDKELN